MGQFWAGKKNWLALCFKKGKYNIFGEKMRRERRLLVYDFKIMEPLAQLNVATHES
jgi:hypothetical protein